MCVQRTIAWGQPGNSELTPEISLLQGGSWWCDRTSRLPPWTVTAQGRGRGPQLCHRASCTALARISNPAHCLATRGGGYRPTGQLSPGAQQREQGRPREGQRMLVQALRMLGSELSLSSLQVPLGWKPGTPELGTADPFLDERWASEAQAGGRPPVSSKLSDLRLAGPMSSSCDRRVHPDPPLAHLNNNSLTLPGGC